MQKKVYIPMYIYLLLFMVKIANIYVYIKRKQQLISYSITLMSHSSSNECYSVESPLVTNWYLKPGFGVLEVPWNNGFKAS